MCWLPMVVSSWRLLERRGLKLLAHAFGGRTTSAFRRDATATLVNGDGVLGFADTRDAPVRGARFAKMMRNTRGCLAHESPGT